MEIPTQPKAQDTAANAATNSQNSDLDEFEVLSVIGSGSFGRICKVRRKSDGKLMARKEIDYRRMKDSERRQLVKEVNILRDLAHLNIVRYYSRYVDRTNYLMHIHMEYCSGGDLAAMIRRYRRCGTSISEECIWGYLAQLLQALHECHVGFSLRNPGSGAILHRDIKPENVFLDAQNNIKLGDFGLSTTVKPETAFAHTFVGTPFYMSPEIVDGTAYNAKSDIWALGCLIYELCNLEPPFRGATHRQLHDNIRNARYPRIRAIYSGSLCDAVAKMLVVKSENRFSAEDLLKLPCLQNQLHVRSRIAALVVREALTRSREEECTKKEKQLREYEAEIERRAEKLTRVLKIQAAREETINSREAMQEAKEQELARTIKKWQERRACHENQNVRYYQDNTQGLWRNGCNGAGLSRRLESMGCAFAGLRLSSSIQSSCNSLGSLPNPFIPTCAVETTLGTTGTHHQFKDVLFRAQRRATRRIHKAQGNFGFRRNAADYSGSEFEGQLYSGSSIITTTTYDPESIQSSQTVSSPEKNIFLPAVGENFKRRAAHRGASRRSRRIW